MGVYCSVYPIATRTIIMSTDITLYCRKVFPNRRKEVKTDEIIHKKFVMSRNTFEFGPLLCGKTREKLRVIVEMLKPEKLDSTTSIKGFDYLDVPAASRRDHKLTFFSYKEGTFSSKVTFRNEVAQEYVFYLVTFKSTPAGIISSIEMITPAQQSTSATVKVENPLAMPVNFTTDCKVPEISLPPHFTVPAQSE